MNVSNVGRLLRKDLALGARSPIVLWALVLPAVLTLAVRGVFGGLFAPSPRLGIVDHGDSAVTAAALQLEGIDVQTWDDEDALRTAVESNDLDAGLILREGFDSEVQSGARPVLEFYVGGESLASNRIILSVTAIDLIRAVAGEPAPVSVEVVSFGEAGFDLEQRLVPLLAVFAVAVAGAMVPAASLVEEKERRTLDGLLVTPVTMNEVLAAKGILGVLLALLTGIVTLLINQAFGGAPLALVVAIAIGAVMMAEIGLMLGSWAPDTNTLFAAWKGGAILIIFPVIFYMWPDLPQWIAKLGVTYYFLEPIFGVAVRGEGLGDVWGYLAVAAAICLALLPLVAFTGRWLERRLATGKVAPAAAAEEPEPAGV